MIERAHQLASFDSGLFGAHNELELIRAKFLSSLGSTAGEHDSRELCDKLALACSKFRRQKQVHHKLSLKRSLRESSQIERKRAVKSIWSNKAAKSAPQEVS